VPLKLNSITNARNKSIKITAGYILQKNPAAKATGTFKKNNSQVF
jgi:hypothetical protein